MIHERLNQIFPRITSDQFLNNEGLGNEIGFWIFDYAPEEEALVSQFFSQTIFPNLIKHQPVIKVAHVDLFDMVVNLLKARNLYDKSVELQKNKGDLALLQALRPVLREDKLAQRLVELVQPQEQQLILVTGVGDVYPMLRTHTLLSALHAHLQATPMLMFFPGRYNGQELKLFNRLPEDNYYRAFQLVP